MDCGVFTLLYLKCLCVEVFEGDVNYWGQKEKRKLMLAKILPSRELEKLGCESNRLHCQHKHLHHAASPPRCPLGAASWSGGDQEQQPLSWFHRRRAALRPRAPCRTGRWRSAWARGRCSPRGRCGGRAGSGWNRRTRSPACRSHTCGTEETSYTQTSKTLSMSWFIFIFFINSLQPMFFNQSTACYFLKSLFSPFLYS